MVLWYSCFGSHKFCMFLHGNYNVIMRLWFVGKGASIVTSRCIVSVKLKLGFGWRLYWNCVKIILLSAACCIVWRAVWTHRPSLMNEKNPNYSATFAFCWSAETMCWDMNGGKLLSSYWLIIQWGNAAIECRENLSVWTLKAYLKMHECHCIRYKILKQMSFILKTNIV